jgi:iron-regulated transporter 1
MLIGGVCASRVGLWVFDISITQLMQEYVPAPIRGVVGGVQQSANAFFGLLAFVLGIFFPKPDEFHIYVTAGYVSVGIATLVYIFGVYWNQDKLRSL